MNNYQREIHRLSKLNSDLKIKSLNLGLFEDIKNLKEIDNKLNFLLKGSLTKIDFVSEVRLGKTLLVGEGNFSFALSLVENYSIVPENITATVFEAENEVSELTILNAEDLANYGANILFEVDATNLEYTFENKKFDNIIFQFPNVGSREPIEGRNPNYILIREFLKSAMQVLKEDGKVLITTVNSSYYRAVFHFDEAAEETGFNEPEIYSFDPNDFHEYIHSMTNKDESAIEDYDSFCTYIFKL